ncbi:unnamed protein product [Prorocentrum cordatum]|uniref:Uncharacterized protein n=1 Tax=Prorocentrum cordatum TaxID=2364126 RepID=A0ABN9UY39_9DINO|nr:unnamed protein product [Polarella glacialis]
MQPAWAAAGEDGEEEEEEVLLVCRLPELDDSVLCRGSQSFELAGFDTPEPRAWSSPARTASSAGRWRHRPAVRGWSEQARSRGHVGERVVGSPPVIEGERTTYT